MSRTSVIAVISPFGHKRAEQHFLLDRYLGDDFYFLSIKNRIRNV